MNKVEQVASVQSLSTITGIENQHPLINPAKYHQLNQELVGKSTGQMLQAKPIHMM